MQLGSIHLHLPERYVRHMFRWMEDNKQDEDGINDHCFKDVEVPFVRCEISIESS